MKAIARAHTNIALIKYWGKANTQLRLPLMSSISMTLDAYYTDTSVEITSNDNEFYLNNNKANDLASKRVFNYIRTLNQHFGINHNYIINSYNHVPTAAGLASSSSAFAALAAAFTKANDLEVNQTELSRLARLGSGSATRSVYGGFVEWQKGTNDQTSIAVPINEQPDLDLQLLAIELKNTPKDLSSTAGMKQATSSPFFKPWLARNELEITEMKQAIATNDFTKIGSLAELNANEMHAVNLTAKPEFTYFEPNTIAIIKLVEQLRMQGIEAYYTIDAGPNVKILTQLRNSKAIQEKVHELFDHVKIIESSFGPGIKYLKK